MTDLFFEKPILNSPYKYPARHWELDENGQPTNRIDERRRRAEFITPIPKPKKRRDGPKQRELVFDEGKGLSTEQQQYDPTGKINELRRLVDRWREIKNPSDWHVTPETARLLQHWRHHAFSSIRPFFCQVEAVEAAIWLTEVAPKVGKDGRAFLDHMDAANAQANPGLLRLALKLATGAGKTTVMAMLIAWQTINAVRRPNSPRFTRGFLVVAPGLTIRDRLRVLQPNDPDSYYKSRELVPNDLLGDLDRAKIVITNYHAFKLRETLELSSGTRALLEGRVERPGDEIKTLETEGQMLQRVMPDLMGMKGVLVLNDEAHHCYRAKPADDDEEGELQGDEEKEAKKNREAARLWISGLEAVGRKLGIQRVIDLSATPFFLRGSGYAEGTLFPWTMSDFSLMDAIECGIVKLPRVPVADNIPGGEMPKFRELWKHVGNPLGRPRTLLIDSEQLESGEALDDNFRNMASDEIDRFRHEIVERTGDRRQAENLSDQELLREVMNTVGKQGRLGDSIRCVVSVSMLTEGWDANTVTHVLGVRAFGTQLLCEQVIGRALRRQSYDLNEANLFNVEYADVLGIPFDFTAKPVVAPPQPPRDTINVKAVRPDRDALEIRFPRVEGYRVELPEERLSATFNDDSTLELTPELVGPSITQNQGIIGEAVDLNLIHTGDLRRSTLLFHLTKRLLYTKWRDPGEEAKLYLFGQLKAITREWLDNHLVCKGHTYPAQLMYQELADMACERITRGIVTKLVGECPIKAVLDPYNPAGSTRFVNFNTSKKDRWQTDARRCHINWVILDSDWEAEFCRVAEAHPRVRAYAKNHNLGFEVPYQYGSESRKYRPDFIVLVDDGRPPRADGLSDLLHLIVEIKGYRREDAKEKKTTMDTYWVPGVNNLGSYGRWTFAEFCDIWEMQADFERQVQAHFDRMLSSIIRDSPSLRAPAL